MSERILTKRRLLAVASALPVLSAFASARAQAPQDVVLTNVSYDPTRELYKDDQRRPSPPSGRHRPARTVTIRSRMAARASRRAR